MSADQPRIRVGTAAWSDHQEFYPKGLKPGDRIAYYAQHFPVVEVNSSYYHIMPERNYRLWVEKTPDDFVFNVKAYGTLTGHKRDEEATPEVFDAFRASYRPFREAGKLGAVLFQFPPWFDDSEANREQIAWCVEHMADDPILVEFRNRSWLTPAHREGTLEFLRGLGLAYVTVDAPQVGNGTVPLVPAVTNANLAYLRLHGRNTETWYKRVETTGERFNYLYKQAEIDELAGVAKQLAEKAREVHVIFNNNMQNYAVVNARMMIDALDDSALARWGQGPQQGSLDI
ncbi:MAG TPA: DUF72 domain-containing protein [Thermomicrobiales bacterium]|nr:DUF72 domain-containing protein [Thermomicrobiales bacterium]